jgi:hypothetical protein
MDKISIFKQNLNTLNIKMYLDDNKNYYGKRLKNYIFEYKNKKIKIAECIIKRETGQTHYFKKNLKNEFEYIILSNKEFYNQQILIIKKLLF